MNRDWGNELCDDSVDVFGSEYAYTARSEDRSHEMLFITIVKEVSDYATKNDGSPNLKQGHPSQWLPVMNMNLNLEPDPTVVNHEYKFKYDSFVC